MAELISTVCCALIILAFCQLIVEAVLPEGSTRRYVVFITGLVTVAVITAAFSLSGGDIAKIVFAKSSGFKAIAKQQQVQTTAGENPYKEYIEKLISDWK